MASTVRWQWIVAALNGIVAFVLIASPCARNARPDRADVPLHRSGPSTLNFEPGRPVLYALRLRGTRDALETQGEELPPQAPTPGDIAWKLAEDGRVIDSGILPLQDLCGPQAGGRKTLAMFYATLGRRYTATATGSHPVDCPALTDEKMSVEMDSSFAMGGSMAFACAMPSATLLLIVGLVFARKARLAEARSLPGGDV
ncbi:hypothetical protein LBMAG42_35870 [Deltaproteobacteria bacterium]|nr:hypothetical protein LBMAG42_35870 [Deltaproteobacteria bacterium]